MNANKLGSGQGRSRGGDKVGHNGNNRKFGTPHQRNGNWEHIKMLSFISCKQTQHIFMKEIMMLNHQCNWFLQHNIGTRLVKSCNKISKANFQGTKQCAKIRGTFKILITKKLLIIRKE